MDYFKATDKHLKVRLRIANAFAGTEKVRPDSHVPASVRLKGGVKSKKNSLQ